MDITAPNPTAPKTADRSRAYRDVYERAVVDAAFLWLLRSIAVDQPHYAPADPVALEQRLDAQLDPFMSSLDLCWPACENSLHLQQPGAAFTAASISLRRHDLANPNRDSNGLRDQHTFKAWFPPRLVASADCLAVGRAPAERAIHEPLKPGVRRAAYAGTTRANY